MGLLDKMDSLDRRLGLPRDPVAIKDPIEVPFGLLVYLGILGLVGTVLAAAFADYSENIVWLLPLQICGMTCFGWIFQAIRQKRSRALIRSTEGDTA